MPLPATMSAGQRLALSRDASPDERDLGAEDGITPFLPDWVVPLQPEGTGAPVFVFPAGHNEARALVIDAKIAAHVGRRHPFWGFRRDDPNCERVRELGAHNVAAEYVAQIRDIQKTGPYLLYGNCIGGYFAWETARQILAAGEAVAGMLFYEVPIRSDFATAKRGGFSTYYRPKPLPVDLTLLMTNTWHEKGRSTAWQQLALGSAETVVIPGETEMAFDRREERIARHIREWIAQAEARVARA